MPELTIPMCATDPSTRPYVSTFMPPGRFHWAIAKDVFEHMEREDLARTAQLAETPSTCSWSCRWAGLTASLSCPLTSWTSARAAQPIEWWSVDQQHGLEGAARVVALFRDQENYASGKRATVS